MIVGFFFFFKDTKTSDSEEQWYQEAVWKKDAHPVWLKFPSQSPVTYWSSSLEMMIIINESLKMIRGREMVSRAEEALERKLLY